MGVVNIGGDGIEEIRCMWRIGRGRRAGRGDEALGRNCGDRDAGVGTELAGCWRWRSRISRARSYLSQSIALNAEYAMAHGALGVVLARLDD
jgi:hypothetical protein